MSKKIVIVGGVAGGATLAARLRRISEETEIIMFEKDEYIAFANCGLPYYIGGVIEDRENLMVQTIEEMSKKYNLDIRNFTEVISIDSEKKEITVRNRKENKEYKESYDELVLSPGASPIIPDFKSLEEASNVFSLRNIPDTDSIKSYVTNNEVQNATVIGGGFIGVEMAENLSHLGINVTLIDVAEHILKPFDKEMAATLELNLKNNNVNILTGQKVSDVSQTKVTLESGQEIKTDLTIMAIGVKPTSKLALDSGLKLSKNGAIVVDENFKTSNANIYAIGDVIVFNNPVINKSMHIPLAWPANRQARVLADVLSGINNKYSGTIGASVLKVNELTAASVGLTEEQLKMYNIECESIIINKGSKAGYYPGGANLDLKLVFDKSGKIYGAQAIGADGVEKRIDVISTAIQMGATVFDLEDIEVCYAPPFNSAKDPVNIVGYAASNIIQGFTKVFKYDQVDNIIKDENKILIDVRKKEEVEIKKIDGSIHIELDEIRDHLSELEQYKTKEIYLYCQVGQRAYTAAKILENNGFEKVYNLSGGFNIYHTVKRNENKKVNFNSSEFNTSNISLNSNVDKGNLEVLDARGLQCPGPIMATNKKMDQLNVGDSLLIKVTDSGFLEDIKAWCDKRNSTLENIQKVENYYEIIITKSKVEVCQVEKQQNEDHGTIVMFSGDLDKALAAMIISQGAQAMGKQMTIFFTFWGLNMLRREAGTDVDKTNFEKMFGAMMPKGASKLTLSQMNMGGMGTKMISKRMKDKNVPSLKEQMLSAQKAGVKFIACTMSMDLMGIHEEELIDGVELGGVAKYIGESSGADLTLFI